MDFGAIFNALVSTIAAATGADQTRGQYATGRSAKQAREHEEAVTLRLLYGEVVFNIISLRELATLSPPSLVLSEDVYSGLLNAGRLSTTRLTVDQVGTVAAPYAIAHLTRFVFARDPLQRAVGSVRGLDISTLENLAALFRAAEEVLRPITWDKEAQARLRDHEPLQLALRPIEPQGPIRRVENALNHMPGYAIAIVAIWAVRRASRWGDASPTAPAGSHVVECRTRLGSSRRQRGAQ